MKNTIITMVMALLTMQGAFAADFTVIVNAQNGVSQISKDDLKSIYLGKKSSWPNGGKIEAVMLHEGKAHEAFSNDIVAKSPAQLATFWKSALFTGTGTPPKTVSSDAEVVQAVSSTPGAVGYISAGAATGSAKAVKVE